MNIKKSLTSLILTIGLTLTGSGRFPDTPNNSDVEPKISPQPQEVTVKPSNETKKEFEFKPYSNQISAGVLLPDGNIFGKGLDDTNEYASAIKPISAAFLLLEAQRKGIDITAKFNLPQNFIEYGKKEGGGRLEVPAVSSIEELVASTLVTSNNITLTASALKVFEKDVPRNKVESLEDYQIRVINYAEEKFKELPLENGLNKTMLNNLTGHPDYGGRQQITAEEFLKLQALVNQTMPLPEDVKKAVEDQRHGNYTGHATGVKKAVEEALPFLTNYENIQILVKTGTGNKSSNTTTVTITDKEGHKATFHTVVLGASSQSQAIEELKKTLIENSQEIKQSVDRKLNPYAKDYGGSQKLTDGNPPRGRF